MIATPAEHAADLDRRVKLAANPATPSQLLAGLARDHDVTVRAAVALNASVPATAQQDLATDTDERVRLLIARKLAGMLPGLSAPDEAELRDRTVAILSGLVRDEAVRIRAAITACLAAIPNLPRDLVLTLARDSEITVSEPVLRLSPMLSADDLLALLAAPPHNQTASAIACRTNLPESVADVIAANAESPAIRVLLANGSAAIREETLDALIARAAAEPDWHGPLVRRPRLGDHAARALSEIVAGQLLQELSTRTDLSPEVLAAIRHRMGLHRGRPIPGCPAEPDNELLNEARGLDASGALTEECMLTALRAGEVRRASAMLAVAAGVSLALIDRATSLRSGKGLVSLVWKAGFSMRAGAAVQASLGRISPGNLLAPTRTGDFPLGPEEMSWQLDFLSFQGV